MQKVYGRMKTVDEYMSACAVCDRPSAGDFSGWMQLDDEVDRVRIRFPSNRNRICPECFNQYILARFSPVGTVT